MKNSLSFYGKDIPVIIYSQTLLSRTRWDCLKTLKYLNIRDIECKILKNNWLGLTNPFHKSIVFDISVFEISMFNYTFMALARNDYDMVVNTCVCFIFRY